MFGLGIGKQKRALEEALEQCLMPLTDELGNVPIPMQTDAAFNGLILGVCDAFSASQGIEKPGDIAKMRDAAFEELYRVESIAVQNRVDEWQDTQNADFSQAYETAKNQTTVDLNLDWLLEYAKANFDRATGLML